MIVRSGVMAIDEVEGGSSIELDRLAPGDIFSERAALMGARNLRGLAWAKGSKPVYVGVGSDEEENPLQIDQFRVQN
ncbi:hypothetical protein [Rhizobium leguminosarum]|uniref:hypothetical protein n=1 Tax=Rhizobium leguminosarum TaxID=384 RepID=UPI0015BCBD32|nr:hypothetical protein [Rhizobium leguminosarum]